MPAGINALAAIIVEGVLSSCAHKPSERQATIITKLVVALVGSAIVGLTFAAQFMRGPVTQMVGSINGSFGSPVVGVFLLSALVPWANKYGVTAGVISSVAFMLTLTLGGQTYGALPRPLSPASISRCHFLNNTARIGDSAINKSISADSSQTVDYSVDNSSGLRIADIQSKTSSPYDVKFFLFDISYEWYTVVGTLICMIIGLVVSFLTRNTVSTTSKLSPKLMFPFCRKFWIKRGSIKPTPESERKLQKPLKQDSAEESKTKVYLGRI